MCSELKIDELINETENLFKRLNKFIEEVKNNFLYPYNDVEFIEKWEETKDSINTISKSIYLHSKIKGIEIHQDMDLYKNMETIKNNIKSFTELSKKMKISKKIPNYIELKEDEKIIYKQYYKEREEIIKGTYPSRGYICIDFDRRDK